MGWWNAVTGAVRDALSLPRPIVLELEPLHTFDDTPRPVADVIAAMTSGSGAVSRDQALSVAAVQRARNELCSIACLPLRQYRGLDVINSPLLRQIDPDIPNVVTLAATVEDLVFEGIAWWRVTARDFAGWPVSARHLPVTSVSIDPPAGASPATLPSGIDPGSPRARTVYVDGVETPAGDLIRFDSPNPGLLRANGRAIRRALALDQLAAMYASNPRPLEVLRAKDDPNVDAVDDEDVPGILAKWASYRRASSTAWLPENVEREDVSPSVADLQLVQLQAQVTLEIANGTGLDPEDLGVSTTSRTYFNAVDRRVSKIQEGRMPIMRAITDRLSMGDVTPYGNRIEFDLTDYLAADPVTQATYWKALKDMGVTDEKEIRAKVGLSGPPPRPKPSPAPASAGTPAAPAESSGLVGVRLNAGQAGATFAATDFESFAAPRPNVDRESRTITGLALPYGAIAKKYGLRYRFLPGSIEWSDVGRVKHYQDHYTPVGKALELTDGKDGLTVKLSVGKGAARDELLQDAADGIYDGLSVGVDFDLSKDALFNEDDNVWDVHRASLREVSTTSMPAFDDARVTKVAASITGGSMHCTHCGQPHAPGIACATFAAQNPPAPTPPAALPQPQAPAAPQTQAVEFNGQPIDMAQLAQLVSGQLSQAAGPAVVDPTRRPTLTASVTEPAPYRFDASRRLLPGTHDFSSDLVAAANGDATARDRAESFVAAAFDVDRADAATLNPNRNRPDLFVDQRTYRYPMWESINKGTLVDSTPFVIPKFNSASGLVATHTEGVEPTPGTYTATSQTITPTAVSGKVEITREAWDQGGNPQLSGLIWRQMEKAYYEALEARAVAVLDAASPTALNTFTAGGGTGKATLVAQLTAGLAGLQFVRGGFSMDNAFLQVDLYKDLIAAVDTAGRPIYPALGPSNAYGTVGQRFGSIEIAPGVTGYPAWALAASGAVAASSYIFDSDSVHGWATAPRRLQFEYRVAYVDVAIWGYGAAGITDINGVREISYDPVA
jgi:HK97 family phage prohead protease